MAQRWKTCCSTWLESFICIEILVKWSLFTPFERYSFNYRLKKFATVLNEFSFLYFRKFFLCFVNGDDFCLNIISFFDQAIHSDHKNPSPRSLMSIQVQSRYVSHLSYILRFTRVVLKRHETVNWPSVRGIWCYINIRKGQLIH